ncbi:MAG: DapH/DapD/GlmU-related protein [Promethearchaeota archaeon]
MSIPASLRAGPTTTNTITSKTYLIFHLLIMWISSLPSLFFAWRFWPQFYNDPLVFFIFLPIYSVILYLLWVFDAIITAKIFLIIINLIHKPREGYFERSFKNKDYRYWSLRATIKKFAIWLAHNFPLPWTDILAFNLFGVKVGSQTTLFDAWVDTEFIEIGKNTIIGQSAIIMSTMVTRDWLIIKKVKIGNNVVIGAHAVVSPGTIIGDNVVLGALAGTSVCQELESNWVYMGVPCRKYHPNEYKSMEESDEEMARKREQFKQYLTIEEIEEVEEMKRSRKEKRALKRYERGQRRLELLKQQKLEIEEALKELDDKKLIDREQRKLERINEKIERELEKERKNKLKADIVNKEQNHTEDDNPDNSKEESE